MLDVVKHALRTIAHALGESDTFSLVSFSTLARVVVESVAMSDAGKAKALEGIDSLRADGQTNLWDGIRLGRDALHSEAKGQGRRAGLCVVAPHGRAAKRRSAERAHRGAPAEHRDDQVSSSPVHTFGFGREVNSELLDEIAQETDGMFARKGSRSWGLCS